MARNDSSTKAKPKRPGARAQQKPRRVLVMVATRKGAWLYHADSGAEVLARRRSAFSRPRP